MCTKEQVDVICVSETWLKDPASDDDIALPDYQLFHRNRPPAKLGGGVVIYIHEPIPAKRHIDLEDNQLELSH